MVLAIIAGLICLAIVLVIVWALLGYNKLVRLRNQVKASWAQIDVQLKRRYDLIPNLVETVKGYAAHERGTLEAVIQARNNAVGAADRRGRTRSAGRIGEHADPDAGSPVRARRELPEPQGQRELPGPADRAGRHRGPDRVRAAVLQQRGPDVQQRDRRRSRRTSSPASAASRPRSSSRSDGAERGPVQVRF